MSENTQRAYPLRYGAVPADVTNTVTIPESFLAAAQLTVVGLQPAGVFISRIAATGLFYEVTLSVSDLLTPTTTIVPLGTVIIPKTAQDFSNFSVTPARIYDTAGHITIGSLEQINTWPSGVYTFAPANTFLELDVVRPSVSRLTSMQVWSGDSVSATLTGSVVLRAGSNIRISDKYAGNSQLVTISATSNSDYTDACSCASGATIGPPIRQINGVTADDNGNVNLLGGGGYEFQSTAGGLTFMNANTAPCCGCEQLDAVFLDVKQFVNGATDLRDYANRLQQAIARLETVVLVSESAGSCSP